MPIYDFKCLLCNTVTEKIVKSDVVFIQCPPPCGAFAERQLSVPAGFRFPDMATLNKRRQRVKEPLWRYPDGHAEPVNP